MTNPENIGHGTNSGVVRHTTLGIVALTVAVLDFTIGTRNMIVAGVVALAVAAYSFIRAHRLRGKMKRRENRR